MRDELRDVISTEKRKNAGKHKLKKQNNNVRFDVSGPPKNRLLGRAGACSGLLGPCGTTGSQAGTTGSQAGRQGKCKHDLRAIAK